MFIRTNFRDRLPFRYTSRVSLVKSVRSFWFWHCCRRPHPFKPCMSIKSMFFTSNTRAFKTCWNVFTITVAVYICCDYLPRRWSRWREWAHTSPKPNKGTAHVSSKRDLQIPFRIRERKTQFPFLNFGWSHPCHAQIYVHVCVYVCMDACMDACMDVYVQVHGSMYVCMYDLYVCMYVCMYVCIYVCMYVRMSLCASMNMCTCLRCSDRYTHKASVVIVTVTCSQVLLM